VAVFAVLATAVSAVLFVLLVPAGDMRFWWDAPLAGLARHLGGPPWARNLAALAVVFAAIAFLVPAAHAALADAEQAVRRLSAERVLPPGLVSPHRRFGTLARAIDITAAAAVLTLIAAGGRVEWLGRAYALAIATTLLLKIAALVQLRAVGPSSRPFTAPFNVRVAGREIPVGLAVVGLVVASGATAMLAAGDVASIATAGVMAGLVLLFLVSRRRMAAEGGPSAQRRGTPGATVPAAIGMVLPAGEPRPTSPTRRMRDAPCSRPGGRGLGHGPGGRAGPSRDPGLSVGPSSRDGRDPRPAP